MQRAQLVMRRNHEEGLGTTEQRVCFFFAALDTEVILCVPPRIHTCQIKGIPFILPRSRGKDPHQLRAVLLTLLEQKPTA